MSAGEGSAGGQSEVGSVPTVAQRDSLATVCVGVCVGVWGYMLLCRLKYKKGYYM